MSASGGLSCPVDSSCAGGHDNSQVMGGKSTPLWWNGRSLGPIVSRILLLLSFILDVSLSIQRYGSMLFLPLLWACQAWKESHALLLSISMERYHKRYADVK